MNRSHIERNLPVQIIQQRSEWVRVCHCRSRNLAITKTGLEKRNSVSITTTGGTFPGAPDCRSWRPQRLAQTALLHDLIMHMHMHIHIHIHTNACGNTHAYACGHMRAYTCGHTPAPTHICTYACTNKSTNYKAINQSHTQSIDQPTNRPRTKVSNEHPNRRPQIPVLA